MAIWNQQFPIPTDLITYLFMVYLMTLSIALTIQYNTVNRTWLHSSFLQIQLKYLLFQIHIMLSLQDTYTSILPFFLCSHKDMQSWQYALMSVTTVPSTDNQKPICRYEKNSILTSFKILHIHIPLCYWYIMHCKCCTSSVHELGNVRAWCFSLIQHISITHAPCSYV
jgi:hypothetical protein